MPNVVKGSKQHRMAVVPHRPVYRIVISCVALVLVMALMAGSYYWGEYSAAKRFTVNEADNTVLQSLLDSALSELEQLQAYVATVEQTSEMDRAAAEEVQLTVNRLRQRVQQLEQDVTLYRQVMSPDVTQPTIIIAEANIQPTPQPRVFRYKVVFRQAGTGDDMIEAQASISLLGLQDGQEVTVPVSDVLEGGQEFQGKLRFRYFQNLEGEIRIPESFHPSQIVVEAESASSEQGMSSRLFNWALSEG
ncbi:MAG: DUF6776 family protein [Pseudohongiellaceae bacterium]|nr:DUF6776 family protein [Pseudohongiellaceae bacterium]